MALIVDHMLEQLVAAAVGHSMMQEQGMIEMRRTARQHQALHIHLGIAAGEVDMQFMAGQCRAGLHRDMGIARTGTDRDAAERGVIGGVMLRLQADMVELGTRADGDMGIDIGPAGQLFAGTAIAVAFQHGGFGLGAEPGSGGAG